MKIKNIIANAMSLNRFLVMSKKVFRRFEKDTQNESVQWARENSIDLKILCSGIDEELFSESQKRAKQMGQSAKVKVEKVGWHLGGGGCYEIIYFLVRHKMPTFCIETGVAAGWSTNAILSALEKNSSGHLYSSDFPYFRQENPEKYIGLLVEESLKKRWTLSLDGDEKSLPGFVDRDEMVDFFHYDSDKSYKGRRLAFSIVEKHLKPGAVVIMDDIQDNLFFAEWVKKTNQKYYVCEFEGKFVGIVLSYSVT